MDEMGIITFQDILLTSWDIQLFMNETGLPPRNWQIHLSHSFLTTFDHVAHWLHQFGFAEAKRNHTRPTCRNMRILGNPSGALWWNFSRFFSHRMSLWRPSQIVSYVHKSAAICDSNMGEDPSTAQNHEQELQFRQSLCIFFGWLSPSVACKRTTGVAPSDLILSKTVFALRISARLAKEAPVESELPKSKTL